MGALQSRFASHAQWQHWMLATHATILATGTSIVIQALLHNDRYVQTAQQETVMEWVQAKNQQIMFAILQIAEHIANLTRPL
jgi:hypothetical protein